MMIESWIRVADVTDAAVNDGTLAHAAGGVDGLLVIAIVYAAVMLAYAFVDRIMYSAPSRQGESGRGSHDRSDRS